MGEFGLPFDYLYRMTMAEFNIRLFAFYRMEKKKDIRTREVAYYSMIGGSLNLKKIPTKKQFWDLGIKRQVIKASAKAMEILKREQIAYNNRHNGK